MDANGIDNEWANFLNDSDKFESVITNESETTNTNIKCTDLYISTKTKIAFLNTEIDIHKLFWIIPIVPYFLPQNGVIKKQIKTTTFSKEESEQIDEKIKSEKLYKQTVLSHLDNPTSKADTTYKHVQKLSVGTSKKDFITFRTKEKGAFYNCFALIFRIFFKGEYKEVHIKVFNTGKLEIPGIQDNDIMYIAIDHLISILQPHVETKLYVDNSKIDTVLINSNFNCGYYINRQKLFTRLKFHFGLISMFDPCSYPGIQSKFYFNRNKPIQDGICQCSSKCSKKGKGNGHGDCMEVSFMIFRTGSVLVVGNCDEVTLFKIYDFIKKILIDEFHNVNEGIITNNTKKKSVKKIKKYTIFLTNEDYTSQLQGKENIQCAGDGAAAGL